MFNRRPIEDRIGTDRRPKAAGETRHGALARASSPGRTKIASGLGDHSEVELGAPAQLNPVRHRQRLVKTADLDLLAPEHPVKSCIDR